MDELAEIEREGCRLTPRHRTLGFAAGYRRDGGTPTAPKEGNIHGVSVLVIDDLAALGIVLAAPFVRESFVREYYVNTHVPSRFTAVEDQRGPYVPPYTQSGAACGSGRG